MRMKSCIGLMFVLLVSDTSGVDGIEWLKDPRVFESISVTPTSLVVTGSSASAFWLIRTFDEDAQARWLKPGVEFVLTPDYETQISDGYHANIAIIPVSFKSQQKGFKIAAVFDARSFGGGMETNATAYVALGDTLTEMDEDDVEMIMAFKLNRYGHRDAAEWVKYEKPQPVITDEGGGATASLPAKSESSGDIPAVESDGGLQPPEQADTIPPTAGNRHRLWRYAVIPLGLLAVLYFMRRNSKN